MDTPNTINTIPPIPSLPAINSIFNTPDSILINGNWTTAPISKRSIELLVCLAEQNNNEYNGTISKLFQLLGYSNKSSRDSLYKAIDELKELNWITDECRGYTHKIKLIDNQEPNKLYLPRIVIKQLKETKTTVHWTKLFQILVFSIIYLDEDTIIQQPYIAKQLNMCETTLSKGYKELMEMNLIGLDIEKKIISHVRSYWNNKIYIERDGIKIIITPNILEIMQKEDNNDSI